ncbi:uncharacterized protein si:dkey-31c13.1 [Betta splendens]|uniref:Uncharacterized protein si:dkey-31c13.1 n=1 Tax=Betta splendens TaxID=158456 RepID=A0A6P7L3E8_BETSP|nr:uncharacterized protein si:dkey-31c13.1 [Betta splendens]
MAEPSTSRVCVRQTRTEVEELIEEIEETTQCKYVSVCNDRNFNDMKWQPTAKNRVFFEKKNDGKSPTISFTGIPFIFIGSMSFECHLGKDRAKRKKERYAQKNTSGDNLDKKRRYLAQDTKKIGCPAELKVTRVAMFPKHKILKDSVWERKRAGQALRSILQENKLVAWENTYYVLVPRLEDHVGHPVLGEVACAREAANPVVEERIKELLRQGVRSVSEMRRHIRAFVKDKLYSGDKPLPLTRYRYYTLHQNLRNIMKTAKDAAAHSSDDEEKLQMFVRTWRERDPEDKFFVRPRREGEEFLLCYQAKWQQRLLKLYGQDVCLLGALSHKAAQMSFFLLWVRTNVCHVAVAAFVVQRETKDAVSEALQLLMAWNEGWAPGHFMVDFSSAQIDAVERVFTGCRAAVCYFHLEKAWGEWMREADHGVQNQDQALDSLRKVSAADSVHMYEQSLKELQDSEEWARNPLFQKWFQTTWLPESKRWAAAFHEESLQHNIVANNGVERLNEAFKYRHLDNYKTSSISEMMTVIVSDFIPQLQKKYIQLNIQHSSGDTAGLPTFLHNRPSDMVMHIKDRMAADLGLHQISEVSLGTFKVTTEGDQGSHVVTLGSNATLPSCSCEDWKRSRLPCKHFCAGFRAGWKWEDLCPQYRDSPLFTLDPVCFSCSAPAPQPEEETLHVPDSSQTDEQMSDGEDYESVKREGNSNNTLDRDPGTKALPQDDSQSLQALPEITKAMEAVNRTKRRCIELLKALSDTIIFVDNQDFLQNLEITLEDVVMELKEHAPRDQRPALNTSTKRRKRKSAGGNRDAAPQLKRSKHVHTNTAGATGKSSAQEKDKVPLRSMSQPQTDALQGKSCTREDELDVELPERPLSGAWRKVGATVLTRADEFLLLTGRRLNDKHINASQCLLREEFPFGEGLNDPDRLPVDAARVPAATDAVQIHRVGRHWLVSAAVRNHVQVYDSLLPGGCTPLTLRQQLAAIYRRFCRGPDGVIHVQMKCAQKQQRAVDGGLFAIANAVSLASGIDPADVQYNQKTMRTHLHVCLTKRKLKMFPHTQRKSRCTTAERRETLSKYCICHRYQERADMVQCDKCHGWYHSSCVNVAPQMITNKYQCPQCS